MKNIFLLFSMLFLCAFNLDAKDDDCLVDLSAINTVIDLKTFECDTVFFEGKYHGDRIVFINAIEKVLHFDGRITSYHSEDALVFLGDAKGLTIGGRLVTNGAITFTANIDRIEIYGVNFRDAFVGIRADTKLPSRGVNIHHNTFHNVKHDGIFLKYERLDGEDQNSITSIHHNNFNGIGWSGVSLLSCERTYVTDNVFMRTGRANQKWLDYAVSISKGSVVYAKDNRFPFCNSRIQCLDSRLFYL